MKLILILTIIAVLVLSGCGTEEKEYQRPTTDVEEPVVIKKDLEPEEIPEEPAPSEDKSDLSSEVQEIVDKASTVTSISYTYQEFDRGISGHIAKVWLKGNMMKQVITDQGSAVWQEGTKFDTIYADIVAKTAERYCEDNSCDDRNAVISTEYSGFVDETPFDVLDNLEGVKSGEEKVGNRESYVIRSETEDGNIKRVWLWTHKGLPVKYEIRTPDNERVRTVLFEKLTYNDVKDSEVVHQEIS